MADASEILSNFQASDIENLKEFSKAISLVRNQQLFDNAVNDREVIRRVSLTATQLGTAMTLAQGGYKIPFQFKSLRVESTSGSTVAIKLQIGPNPVSGRDYMILSVNDYVSFGSLRDGYLFWDAQSGATAEIIFAIDAEMKPGKLVTAQAGNVIVGEGTAVSTAALQSVTTSAAALLASSTTRTVTLIQNKGSVSIFVGDSGVTSSTGIEIQPGGSFEWRNSAALYAITASVTNASIAVMTQTSA